MAQPARFFGLVCLCTSCFHPTGSDSTASTVSSGSTSMASSVTTVATDKATSSTAGTSTGLESTTTSSPTTGAPVDNGRHFRIEELTIIDPHFFYGMPCLDITGMVNASIADKIAAGDFNLLLGFKDFDLDALEPSISEAESCDLGAETCVPTMSISLSVAAERIEVGACSTLDPVVLSAANVGALNNPQPTCFRTLKAELALPLPEVSVPLHLVDAQMVFNLDPLADANAVTNGLLYGFLPRKDAEVTTLTLLMLTFSIWDLVTGQPDPAGCAAANPDHLPSDDLLEGQQGVWMAFNFTAKRVELVSP